MSSIDTIRERHLVADRDYPEGVDHWQTHLDRRVLLAEVRRLSGPTISGSWTSERHAAAKARCDAAAPGPWRGDLRAGGVKYGVWASDGTRVLTVDHKNARYGFLTSDDDDPEGLCDEGNELFVLAAREDLPDALAAIEARDEEIERLGALVAGLEDELIAAYTPGPKGGAS